tara:strand:- start:57389 stop:58228 length:840 start_codon:yes stop_codon:yes gene_type:complete
MKVFGEQYIVYKNFPSEYVIPRNIEIWLPKQYDTLKSLPVIYMFDGQNIFHGKKVWASGEYDDGWQVDKTLDSLFDAKIIPPTIVVGIFNTGKRRYSEYTPAKPINLIKSQINYAETRFKNSYDQFGIVSDSLLKFIVKELKPFIDNNFKTKSGKEHTFVAGSSVGGLISAYAVCEYPNIFGSAACLSTHWPVLDGAFIEYLKKNIPEPRFNKFYFDFGTVGLDSLYEPYQIVVDSIMIAKGYQENVSWLTKKFNHADHNEKFWQARFHYPVEFLFSNQ